MTRDEYIEARDSYYVQSNDANRNRYLRAFLDWAGSSLDRLGVKYDARPLHIHLGGKEMNIMTMELTPDELKLIEKRRADKAVMSGVGIIGEVIRRDGNLTATRYYGGHHPQFALYDGDTMVCLCVYKKGALNAMDYILKLKKGEAL